MYQNEIKKDNHIDFLTDLFLLKKTIIDLKRKMHCSESRTQGGILLYGRTKFNPVLEHVYC